MPPPTSQVAGYICLLVCNYIERNKQSQIPCMCSHVWPMELILTEQVVAMSADRASEVAASHTSSTRQHKGSTKSPQFQGGHQN